MSEKRDLEWFMSHPDQMENLGEDDLSALMGGAEVLEPVAPTAGEDQKGNQENQEGAKSDEQVVDSAATGAKDEDAKDSQQQQQSKDEAAAAGREGEPTKGEPQDGQPVLKSKDGKHEIPYAVLEGERAARRASEEALAKLQDQFEELKRQVQGGQTTQQQREQAQEQVVSQEELEALRETSPETAKLIEGLVQRNQQLFEIVQQVAGNQQQMARRDQLTVQQQVQQAIDENPVLRYWQNEDPEMWNAAAEIDKALRASPRTAGLTFSERFAKVVAAMEATYGPTELPEKYRPKASAPAPAPTPAPAPAPAPAAKPPAQQASTKKVDEALKKAAEQQVNSLSDIPGGTPTGATETEELANLSAAELGDKFLTMPEAQLKALIARIG